MTIYQPGETIILKSIITKDGADSLSGITVTVSIHQGSTALLTNAAMNLDSDASTDDSKVYYYYYTIPSTVSDPLTRTTTVTSSLGYKTIEKELILVGDGL